ncbi:MAG TPA: VOC family protein [Chloroflexota bacterium]|nr:VOC family protein [Chloroflexota bacterium]
MPPVATTQKSTKPPVLKIDFLSHGTLEVVDLQASRRFYEEVLGLECIQNSPVSLMLRLGGDHIYVAVQTGKKNGMGLMNHNGLDVASEAEVDRAYELLKRVTGEYGIGKIQPPHKQHGAYSFYFQDPDNNWWEILSNPPRGYAPWFERTGADLTGLSGEDLRKQRHTSGFGD